MGYNVVLGKLFFLVSVISCLYSLFFLLRISISIWTENVWMIAIFVFGIPSLPYLIFAVRSYGEVAWRGYIRPLVFGMKYMDLMKEHAYYTMVLPSDCDVFNHMNNSRYPREVDFARTRWYVDSGLLHFQQKERRYLIMVATSVRYRRSLEVFQKFKITTKMIFWDEKHIYLQHKFITLTSTDSVFINAIIVSKMRVLFNGGTEEFLCKFLGTTSRPDPPKMTPKLEHFLNYLEACSYNLKKESVAMQQSN